MSQRSKTRSQRHENVGRGAQGSALVLLDDRQWAYLRRRYGLTPREVQIADLVCRGLRNGSIAKDLKIRPGTVKTHVRNIYRKVKVRSKITMLLRFMTEANDLPGSAACSSSQLPD
ncbi:MAG: response regulator transcription factor [Phycisphaerales bacterium]|nr:MAG: response regulator transcription factor [Phycisphaerales bacterium]